MTTFADLPVGARFRRPSEARWGQYVYQKWNDWSAEAGNYLHIVDSGEAVEVEDERSLAPADEA